MSKKAYLVLEDGTVFEGKSFGAKPKDPVYGEMVFTTEMMGYMETLTDPNYHGQILLQTFPLIGNYGVIPDDFLSDYGPAAYIVKYPCQDPSNFRSMGALDTFLDERGIICLHGVDTRAIAKTIREHGTLYGTVTNDESAKPQAEDYRLKVKGIERIKVGKSKGTVAVLDFGMNVKIKNELLDRDYNVTILPAETPVESIIAAKPNGIVLSNGPGDPTANQKAIQNIKSLLGHKIPTLGIGLGHQILALANGFRTERLRSGHRGTNQGIKCLMQGKVHITRQNHGYAVVSNSINKKSAAEIYQNVNDKSNEGIEYKSVPAFSVQFDPCGLAKTAELVFGRFAQMMDKFGRVN
jgi:carbamoyl-phosphate synthase small subunit